ncbi:MAG: DUF402 domain-containing protein [Christensenellaceae bacterium]|nr:DUF402 domain-containing protein [Christensenellaceae bacterium]
MRRSDWHRILERDYVCRACETDGMREMESVLTIKEITAPLRVHNGAEQVTIVEKGYRWVQIAREGAFVWLTAMFDDAARLLQMYFDITAGNRFDAPDNPTFRDMYLDVVVTAAGKISVLDQDELDEALAKGNITPDEHDHAEAVCRGLCAWLEEHGTEVMARCERVLRDLEGRV